MDKKEYAECFKDPRWQKLRLKILERDAFTCQRCGSSQDTLNVHHRYYEWDKKPWDYPMSALITLCEECHKEEKEYLKESCDELIKAMKEKFFASEIQEFACEIYHMSLPHVPDVYMSALCWFLKNKKNQKKMIEAYFKSLARKNKVKNG